MKSPPPGLPDGRRWMSHLLNTLLPFWDRPDALGDPIGNFPSRRCNDGSLFHPKTNPCAEIADHEFLATNTEYTVSRSRQVYGYGVAFHLTGDPRYLEYARAGVEYLRRNAFDRANGGVHSFRRGDSRSWQPEPDQRNPQELAYSLLGPAFYYYLTRDTDVLGDILAVKRHIFEKYFNPRLNALQWLPSPDGSESSPTDKRLTAQLDQLTAYLVLLTPLLTEPERSLWIADLEKLSGILIDGFYSNRDNLFFPIVNDPSHATLKSAGADFGHSIKAMSMIYHTGLIAGLPELVSFAATRGTRILSRAYREDSGSWANGLGQGGVLIKDQQWWIHNELDQFTMVIALRDPTLAKYLYRTTDYYFKRFVDHEHGEVWSTLDGDTHQPKKHALPKCWHWKSAYHTFEHTLLGYITSQEMHGEPVTLYFAFQGDHPCTVQPYLLQGRLSRRDAYSFQGIDLYRAEFRDIH